MVRARLALLCLPLLVAACSDDSDPQFTTAPTNPTNPTASATASMSGTDPTHDVTTGVMATDAGTGTDPTAEPTTEGPATTSTSMTTQGPDPTLPATTTSDDTTGPDATSSDDTTGGGDGVVPPLGGSSMGQGGGPAGGELVMTGTGVQYRIIAPGGAGPLCFMVVYSGTEGGQTMTSNLLQVADFTGNGDCIFAVLDGVTYNGDGQAGADVIDDVRADYDVDNDRTYLFSESAGTTAGLELGLMLRQSYFAAYWANDVNAAASPVLDAAALGFQPWGNAGPGGAFAQATAIVDGMAAAGYRIEEPAPYDGPGADVHGDPDQFIAGLSWFPGRSRQ
jgi:hypothetical protein